MSLALAAAMVAGPVAGPSPARPPAPVSVRVTVTTANVLKTLSPGRARADVARATRGSSVALLQEMWTRSAHAYAPPGWGSYQTDRPMWGCREVAVMWDRAVWRAAHPRGVLLDASVFGIRCAVVVILHHRATGLVVPVIDVHMLPGVEWKGHTRDPRRVAAYARAMRRAVELVATVAGYHRGRALIGGDWNVDYPADRRVQARAFPYAALHVELDTHWAKLPTTAPTHGTRRIDTIWWTEGRFHPVDSDTLGHTYSDHSFVRLTLAARSG